MVVNQHHINVEHMRKNPEYFGEALAMCEEFGLLQLMQFTQNWDEDLVVQFFSTVYFIEDEHKIIKWLTNGRLLEATWVEFGDSLGYPILDTSEDELPMVGGVVIWALPTIRIPWLPSTFVDVASPGSRLILPSCIIFSFASTGRT
jgi:hypothetical protein